MRGNNVASGAARYDWHDLEFHQIAPMHDPLLQQPCIVALHELEAPIERWLDPAVEVFQTLGHLPAVIAQPAIDRFWIAVTKPFDDHKQHDRRRRYFFLIL
jgi:hypothetical protein